MSMKKDPRFIAPQKAMQFDSPTPIIPPTDDEKAAWFWSRYNSKIDPFVKYKAYWKSSAIDPEITIRKLKDFYRTYVLKQGWSEEKFLTIVHEIFERDLPMVQFSFDAMLKLYISGELRRQLRHPVRRRKNVERIRRRR